MIVPGDDGGRLAAGLGALLSSDLAGPTAKVGDAPAAIATITARARLAGREW
jgi:hypothetical protein